MVLAFSILHFVVPDQKCQCSLNIYLLNINYMSDSVISIKIKALPLKVFRILRVKKKEIKDTIESSHGGIACIGRIILPVPNTNSWEDGKGTVGDSGNDQREKKIEGSPHLKKGNHSVFKIDLHYLSSRILLSPYNMRQINIGRQLQSYEETHLKFWTARGAGHLREKNSERRSTERKAQTLHIIFFKILAWFLNCACEKEPEKKTATGRLQELGRDVCTCCPWQRRQNLDFKPHTLEGYGKYLILFIETPEKHCLRSKKIYFRAKRFSVGLKTKTEINPPKKPKPSLWKLNP